MEYTDDVNGVVIGSFLKLYKFYTLPDYPDYVLNYIDKTYEENDQDAEQWFKDKYPDHHKKGVEMRCYDQKKKKIDN